MIADRAQLQMVAHCQITLMLALGLQMPRTRFDKSGTRVLANPFVTWNRTRGVTTRYTHVYFSCALEEGNWDALALLGEHLSKMYAGTCRLPPQSPCKGWANPET